MLRNPGMWLLGALALVLGWAVTSEAAKYNKVVEIGDKAPTFADLKGSDGKTYSLSDMKDAKVVVVCFTCNGCPVAVAYEDKLVKFAGTYKSKGVELVCINPNGDALDAMKERSDKKGFNFPYVADNDQQTARAYGATVTPHFFVLDQDRTIAYMGNFDKDGQATLTSAVDALLAGKKPELSETQQFGCGIPYKKR